VLIMVLQTPTASAKKIVSSRLDHALGGVSHGFKCSARCPNEKTPILLLATSSRRTGNPLGSTQACIFDVNPPLDRPISLVSPPPAQPPCWWTRTMEESIIWT
jgi:hypothetical protein